MKNQVQAILHRNLVPRCPATDLFGLKGRAWLGKQELPADERQAVEALLRQLDFHGQELAIIGAQLGQIALSSDDVKRLMTIPGVDATVALSIVAAVGDFGRFASPGQLVSYLGLNPRVRQSGGQPASHGRITKQGRAQASRDARRAQARSSKPRGARRRSRRRSGVLRARALPPGHADRDRRDRTETHVSVLAPRDQERGPCVRQAVADRAEASPARAQSRDALTPRPERRCCCLFAEGGPSSRARARSTGRARIPPTRRRLASQSTCREDGRGRRQWGATVRSPNGTSCAAGPSPRPCSSLGGRATPTTQPSALVWPHQWHTALTFSSVV